MSTAPTLPPLPEPKEIWLLHDFLEYYTAEQMHDYATANASAHASALAQRVDELEREVERLRAREKACQTMGEAQKVSLLRALQECCLAVGIGELSSSPADLVNAVRARAQEVERLTTARDVAVELGATYAARADELAREAMTWRNRHDEMRALLDSRPAINAGLIAAYITWNGQCYQLDWLNARDAARKGDQQHG